MIRRFISWVGAAPQIEYTGSIRHDDVPIVALNLNVSKEPGWAHQSDDFAVGHLGVVKVGIYEGSPTRAVAPAAHFDAIICNRRALRCAQNRVAGKLGVALVKKPV